jgi:hypothetical protein
MINEILLKRAQKLIQKDPALHGFKKPDRDELISLSSAILGKAPCKGCPSEQAEIFIELRTLINNLTPKNQNPMKNESGKFTIAANVTVHDQGRGKVFTENNITDEDALDLLSRNPRSIGQFKNYPKDWKAQAAEYAAGKSAAAAKAKAAKIKAAEALESGKPAKPAAKPAAPAKPAKAPAGKASKAPAGKVAPAKPAPPGPDADDATDTGGKEE